MLSHKRGMADRDDTVVPFRRPRNRWPRRSPWTKASAYGGSARPWWKRVSPVMVVLPLAAFTAALVWPSSAPAGPETASVASPAVASEDELRARRWPTSAAAFDAAQPKIGDARLARLGASADTLSAHFTRCGGGARVTCVIDGDTFWFRGAKIRVADINTPEVSDPACPAEARLGARATWRLQALLNAGPFTLEAGDRDRDRYGRLLRTVMRDGESLGLVLVREGLAEEWGGSRGSWC